MGILYAASACLVHMYSTLGVVFGSNVSVSFSGAFTKSRKVTAIFVMPVCHRATNHPSLDAFSRNLIFEDLFFENLLKKSSLIKL